jgi:hypothetical protein
MKALYHGRIREAMARDEETVETVYRNSCITITGLKPRC